MKHTNRCFLLSLLCFAALPLCAQEVTYFTTQDAYLYKITGPHTVELAQGGCYQGTVTVPKEVSYRGTTYAVAGVGEKAFSGNEDVTGLQMDFATQYLAPGALMGSQCTPFAEETLPRFVYDIREGGLFGKGPEHFIYTCYPDSVTLVRDYNWLIFKSYVKPAHFVGYNNPHPGEENVGQRRDMDFISGALFDLNNPEDAATMFRGYQNVGKRSVIAPNSYVATHEFPAFYRWLSSEKKISMPAEFTEAMEQRYGRKVDYSYAAAYFKEREGTFAVTEFVKDTVNGEAMVVLSWSENNEIKATYARTTTFDPGYFYESRGKKVYTSVWNVDDDGDYGIPGVTTIAVNHKGEVDIFMIKLAPESTNTFILRQNGDQLELIFKEAWYVYVM